MVERIGWVRAADGVVTVTAPAELDFAHAPEVAAAIDQAVAALGAGGRKVLRVDLGPAAFVDSSGLAVLITAHRKVAAVGGRMVVVDPRPIARELLAVTGLDAIFEVTPADPRR